MKKTLKYALPLLPFICFIAGYIVSNIFVGASSHKAPHIIGLTIHEALKLTSQNHVSIKLIAEKECSGTIPGTILTQKPIAGRLMKQNQAILVTVSKQPIVPTAPDMLSKTSVQTANLSKENNLKMKQYFLHSSLPKNTCIGQAPQPNAPISDRKIVIYMAQEKQNLYIMPDFIDQKLSVVVHALKQHQLNPTITLRHEKIDNPYPENLKVVEQKPRAGSFVSLDQSLNVQLEVAELTA